jgi:hypothetical protein
MSLEADGTLVVGDIQDPNDEGGAVLVFAPGSCGDVAPVEEIVGSNTGFNLLDGVGTDAAGTIYADSSNDDSVQVFPAGANGNVAPEYTISGSNTGLNYPDDVIVGFNGELYVTNGYSGLTVFAPGAKGNATPIEAIVGSNTDFGAPDDMAVDTAGNMFVTDSGSTVGPALLEYASGATGNVAPIATLTGAATMFAEPEGVAVAGPPITSSATLATSTASSIPQGSQTHDTATLANGKSPTGSLVYKLFGPNDSTCSKAPAYVSPATMVKGDGMYTSPSFAPTGTGTYSWVDLYSGDTNNAPVTTACSDPSETVTVGSSASATLTTAAASSSISLGTQTYDTATLAGGKSPTGSLVYKLFGPNDSTCSKAPAYVSPAATVKGDGTYTSPSFAPTGAGTYSWVDLYSGDSSNAPVTTACSDPSETVTVGSSSGCPPTVNHVYKYGNFREEIVKVVIRGTCLRGAISVHFGDTPAYFTVISNGSIRAYPPQHTAGSVDVTVTTGVGTSPPNPPYDQYVYFLPHIVEVTPHSGPSAGGAGVVIRGIGLNGATSVTFGGVPARFTVVKDGRINAVAPQHTKGTVVVSVTNSAGTSLISPPHSYTYKG